MTDLAYVCATKAAIGPHVPAELLDLIDQYEGNSINKALHQECMRKLYLLAGSLNFYKGAKTNKIKSMIEFNKHMRDRGESLHWLENGCSDLSNMVSCLHPNGRRGCTGQYRVLGFAGTHTRRRRPQDCFTRVVKWLFT